MSNIEINVTAEQLPEIINKQIKKLEEIRKKVKETADASEKAKEQINKNKENKYGIFKTKQYRKDTQLAMGDLAEAVMSNTEAQTMMFEYIQSINKVIKYLFGLCIKNSALQRTMAQQLELKLKQASQEEIDDLVRQEIENLLHQIKAQEGVEKRINDQEIITKEHDIKFDQQERWNKEHDIKFNQQERWNKKIEDQIDSLERNQRYQKTNNFAREDNLETAISLFLNIQLEDAFSLFLNLANKNDGTAMFFLGYFYYWNNYGVVELDDGKAFRWIRKGAETGNIYCKYFIYEFCYMDIITLTDEEEKDCRKWRKETTSEIFMRAKNGDWIAQVLVTFCGNAITQRDDIEECSKKLREILWTEQYAFAQNVFEDEDEEKFEEAFNYLGLCKEYPPAKFLLGLFYINGWVVSPNIEKGLAYCDEAYHRGQYHDSMGDLYNSLGVYYIDQDDISKAIIWYERGTKAGSIDSVGNLCACYLEMGEVDKAIEVCQNYVEDTTRPMRILADYFYEESDYENTMKYYLLAAEKNDSIGQVNVGFLYQFGKGVSEDLEKAKYWYEKAIKNDNAEAMWRMGTIYEYEDDEKALHYFKMAEKKEYEPVYLYLKDAYLDALGTRQDLEKALHYGLLELDYDEDYQALISVGRICLEMNKPEQAIDYFERAMDYDNDEESKMAKYCLSRAEELIQKNEKDKLFAKNYEKLRNRFSKCEFVYGKGIDGVVNKITRIVSETQLHVDTEMLKKAIYSDYEYADIQNSKQFEKYCVKLCIEIQRSLVCIGSIGCLH